MGQRLDQRTALAAQPADGDLFHVVDVSDTTDNANGSSKKITYANLVPDASTTVEGKVELATDAETITGTDTVRAVTPSNIAAKMDTDGTLAGNLDTRIPSQKAVKTYSDRALNTSLTRIPLYAPQGFLINGKIVVTDTGTGLKVEIKTLADATPSASDPVYCRIGDTVRTISSALSVTKADGTNWFNSGSTELATFEIDYFVYLGYNATDGVVIGFSRFPGASQYSDFSVTTTNEKYCAISNITNAASTDYYEVIGRFAATLSTGAGYTWSVPTYTAINIIQKPIYETRWLSLATAWGGFSSNPTGTFTYKIERDSYSMMYVDASAGTSNATTLTFTGPMAALSSATMAGIVFGKDNSVNLTTPSHLTTTAGSITISAFKSFASTAWTGAGTKDIYVGMFKCKI